jgi:hypothetical protein
VSEDLKKKHYHLIIIFAFRKNKKKCSWTFNRRFFFLSFLNKIDWLFFWCLTPLSAIFQLYHGTSFSGGGNRSTRREPPTLGKQLVNFITLPLFRISNKNPPIPPNWKKNLAYQKFFLIAYYIFAYLGSDLWPIF